MKHVATSLGELLLGGARELVLEAHTVIVAADGVLNTMPLQELVLSSVGGDPILPSSNCWMRIPSANALALLRRRSEFPRLHAPGGILALTARFPGQLGELKGTKREVETLGNGYRNTNVLVADKGLRFNADLLANYDVLHLATHAKGDDRNPWQSMLMFDPDTLSANPRANEIAEMTISARLVFLSGCSTAAGHVLTGEGVTGLASAFLAAGVPAVLATLWDVDDHATVALVEEFYRNVSRGETVGEALRLAQLEMVKNPATAHPFFWAGFVVLGESGIRLPLDRKKAVKPILAAIMILIPMLVFWLRKRNSSVPKESDSYHQTS